MQQTNKQTKETTILTEDTSVADWGWEGTISRQEEEITKESEKTLVCDGHFNYLDYGNCFMGVKTYQIVHSKYALLVLYQLFFNKADF